MRQSILICDECKKEIEEGSSFCSVTITWSNPPDLFGKSSFDFHTEHAPEWAGEAPKAAVTSSSPSG